MKEGSWYGEVQQQRKDNTVIDILGSISLIRDGNGIPSGVVAVNRDITEQKRAEAALHESESRYRLLADHITDVVASFDMNYIITYISPSCREALGYKPEEMIGQRVDHYIHPNDSSIILMVMETVVDARFMVPSITFRFRHKDGHFIWLESVGRIIVSEKTGKFLGVISSSRDVTERKQAEEILGTKFEDERKFQKYLKELHEITIELTQIDQLDNFFKEVVSSGLNRLGFERFALFLYDAPNSLAMGTYGTSTNGDLVAEHHIQFDFLKWPGILARTLHRAELFSFEEEVTLYTGSQVTGHGWSGCAALRNGTEVLGWLVVDNGLYHQAASKPQLEILGLYGIAVGSLLARKQLEVDLRESKEKFRLLADNVTDIITRENVVGTIVYVSPSIKAQLGYDPQELLNAYVYDRVHPDDKVWVQMLAREVIAQGGILPVITYRVRHKEGHYLWMETDSQTIYGPDGKILEFISSSRNVTQRKMAEEALRESEEKFRLLVEAAPVAIVISNQMGEITLVNNQAQQLFGYAYTELISQPIETLIPEIIRYTHVQHRATYNAMPHHTRPTGTGTVLFALRKNGQQFPVEVELSSIETNTGLLVMSFILDMTTHKAAEDALRQALTREKELNELKSRFVSMASHEFRTPLASILALNETLSAYRSTLSDDQIEQKLGKMRDQIEHLNHIMEDVLQLARLQARRMEFHPTRLNLDSLCRSVLDEFQTRSDSHHEWYYHCDETLQDVILDKKLMRQIISNLISNAMKYSPMGKLITVTLTWNENRLIIRVQDQGIGIPTADLALLFEPFHRATNVETISGTGLGLTIVKESVELHGGTISIESEIGVGTIFMIQIPLAV